MSKIDRVFFYETLKKPIRPLSQSDVNAINIILDFYDNNNYDMTLGGLASYLGQSEVESMYSWLPIRELGAKNYIRYLIGKLGVNNLYEAYMFRGWGRIQTTGETNFLRAIEIINKHEGLIVFRTPHELGEWLLDKNHDKAKESYYDLIVSFECFTKGLYTGKKSSDYFKAGETPDFSSFFYARKIVNPNEIKRKPNLVTSIAKHSLMFYDALKFK